METFQLPLREIRKKFTTSELVLMAWRSQEQHFHFKNKIKTDETEEDETEVQEEGTMKKKKHGIYGPNDHIPADLPEKFYAKEDIYDARGKLVARKGEIVLSQVTGEEAKRYFACLNIPFPDMGAIKMVDESDPVTQQIRDAYKLRR